MPALRGALPVPLVAAGAALLLYTATAAPSITWRNGGTDSGDLVTAAVMGSVAHPPGYPTYLLAGRLLTRLPLEPARSLALLSACSGAIAVGGTAAAARRGARAAVSTHAGVVQVAALAVAATVAAAPLLWANSTFAEVNAPVAAVTAVWLGAALWQPRSVLGSAATGLALGVATGIHPLLAGMALLTLAGIASTAATWRSRSAAGAALAAGMVAGASFYLTLHWYPPVGPVNWFAPQGWDGWRALVQADAYRTFVAPAYLGPRLLQMGRQVAINLGIVGAVAALAALLDTAAPRGGRHLAAVALPAALAPLYVLFAALYLVRDAEVYVLPATLLLTPAAGAGIAKLIAALPLTKATRRPLRRLCATALVVTLVPAAAEVALYWRQLDVHADRTAVDFAARTLDAAPAGAILLASGDEATFALWYARYALGRRPDVSVVNEDLLPRPWYRAQVRRLGVPLPLEDDTVIPDSRGALLEAAAHTGVAVVPVRAPNGTAGE